MKSMDRRRERTVRVIDLEKCTIVGRILKKKKGSCNTQKWLHQAAAVPSK